LKAFDPNFTGIVPKPILGFVLFKNPYHLAPTFKTVVLAPVTLLGVLLSAPQFEQRRNGGTDSCIENDNDPFSGFSINAPQSGHSMSNVKSFALAVFIWHRRAFGLAENRTNAKSVFSRISVSTRRDLVGLGAW
jgi:hypothetical protein